MADNDDANLGKLNTGAMFNRSTGLAGKLGSPAGKPAPATETDSDQEPQAPAKRAAKSSSAKPKQAPAPRRSSGGASSNRSVYLDVEVRAALRQRAAQTGQTLTDIILTSVEAAYDKLDDLLDPPPAAGGLFERAPVRRRKPGERMHTTLRLTPRNEEILDEITSRYGAGRSELIEAALRYNLGVD